MKISAKITALALIGITSLASQALGQATLVSDNFDRADGSLVGTNPTPGPGGTWANHSGTIGDLLISGGQALVQHGAPSEDANTLFAEQSAGVLTANFDMTVNDDTVIGGTDFEYFAHFFTQGDFNFRARLDVVAPTVAGDYTLGISSTTSTAEATFATDFSFGVTYNVDLSIDFTTGLASATVGGVTITGTSVIADTVDAFALRQSDSGNNESILVDNLMVMTSVPEPSTYALLLGALGLGVVMIRRRR